MFVWVKLKGKLVRSNVRTRIRGMSGDRDEMLEIAVDMVRNPRSIQNINLSYKKARWR